MLGRLFFELTGHDAFLCSRIVWSRDLRLRDRDAPVGDHAPGTRDLRQV